MKHTDTSSVYQYQAPWCSYVRARRYVVDHVLLIFAALLATTKHACEIPLPKNKNKVEGGKASRTIPLQNVARFQYNTS